MACVLAAPVQVVMRLRPWFIDSGLQPSRTSRPSSLVAAPSLATVTILALTSPAHADPITQTFSWSLRRECWLPVDLHAAAEAPRPCSPAVWAAADGRALDEAWINEAVVDLGSQWGQHEYVTAIGFAA